MSVKFKRFFELNLLVWAINNLRKSNLLKFCCVPSTSAAFLAFFEVATNSTNETNKAGGMCHYSVPLF
jgi:hypothetical protein